MKHGPTKRGVETLNLKDRRILFECNLDGHESDAVLARRCGLSHSVFAYRLKRLVSIGVIRGFTLVPNLSDLGLTAYGVYCRASSSTEQEIVSFLKTLEKNKAVYWTTRLAGEYDLLIAFASPEPKVFLDQLTEAFKGKLKNHQTSIAMRVKVTQYQRRYLVTKSKKLRTLYFETGGKERIIAPADKMILESYSDSPRASYSEVGKKLGLDRTTIKRRFGDLLTSGVVAGVISLIDSAAVGYQGYILLLSLTSYGESERKVLKSLCDQGLYTNELIETIGPWQVEVHAEVPDQLTLQRMLSDIRNALGPAVREIKVVLNVDYYKKYKFPLD